MTNTFQEALQEKPSAMIRYALQALDEAEQVPHYRIDMDEWHAVADGKCFMCLGGAAAIKRAGKMGELVNGTMALSDYDGCDEYECALDDARRGKIGSMFSQLKLDWDKGYDFNRAITSYANNRAQFKADLTALAADLERAGY